MIGTESLFSKENIDNLKKAEEAALQDLVQHLENVVKLNGENLDQEQLKIKLQQISITSFLGRLYMQAKMISQIVCFVWRWADSENDDRREAANAIKKYFEHPTPFNEPNQTGETLKKLLGANPQKTEGLTLEDNLLRKVFPNDYQVLPFPIFNKFELGQDQNGLGYLFLVNINSFHGTIKDATKNAPELFSFEIPYPPAPKFSNATVTEQELEDWVNNREKNVYFADNPYIPTSCS